MAALFNPRFFSQPEPNFRGLFRLLEDFDQYSSAQNDGRSGSGAAAQFFTPKFDLKETETSYELHGELPGLNKENVSIEFTDPQTIVVRGKVERSYTRGTPPAGALEASSHKGALTESGEGNGSSTSQPTPDMPHKVTVEDENENAAAKTTTESASTDVAKTTTTAGTEAQQQQKQPAAKYWVSERSVGQFSRTFHFPTRVDNDATSADLANGILTVTVPKAKKMDSKRITIN